MPRQSPCDPESALQFVQTTLDMRLPQRIGLATTGYISPHFRTPVSVVRLSVIRGGWFSAYDARAAGAVNALPTPKGDETEGDWERRLITSVKTSGRRRVTTHLRAGVNIHSASPPVSGQSRCELIAIDTSAGGSGAVLDRLGALPSPLLVPAARWLIGTALDSAAGRSEIRRAGSLTITRDEATTLVQRIPREADLSAAAERVLLPSEIGFALAVATAPVWETGI